MFTRRAVGCERAGNGVIMGPHTSRRCFMNQRMGLFLVAVALAVAALPLPYAYYQLLRWVACAAFCWAAWSARSSSAWPWLLALLAVLFNPLVPIRMSKGAWVVADIAAAVVLAAFAAKWRPGSRT